MENFNGFTTKDKRIFIVAWFFEPLKDEVLMVSSGHADSIEESHAFIVKRFEVIIHTLKESDSKYDFTGLEKLIRWMKEGVSLKYAELGLLRAYVDALEYEYSRMPMKFVVKGYENAKK